MRITVGSDHAGYEAPEPYYKPSIIEHLRSGGHEVVDCGVWDEASADYPDVADKVARALLSGEAQLGVLLCGTGAGMAIAANRHRGIRAAACATPEMARLARDHNDANIICIGRRILPLAVCLDLIDVFLRTPFSGGERHRRRIGKMG